MKKKITEDKLEKYFDITGEALGEAEKAEKSDKERAKIVLKMVKCYYEDALHFKEKGDYVLAYGALNYAHGWLDCGARLGLFDVHDSRLFTVD